MKNEKIFSRGKMFELVHITQPDGRVFEIARRAPGVRLIIKDEKAKKLLLTKEHRQELKGWDYRLPGGKVFNSLEEYDAHRKAGDDIAEAARTKAIAEAHEEAGVEVKDLKLFKKSTLGATVEWDLYVFEVLNWVKASSQKLEAGEKIETDNWFSFEEVKKMILSGEMREERTALIVLQWLATK